MAGKAQNRRNHLSPWTIKDIQYVEQHYGRLPTEEIAIKLGRSAGAMQRIALTSGVGKPGSRPWIEDERSLIRLHYYKGLDYMQVLLPGRTRLAINSQACHLGVTVSNCSNQERQFLKDHHGIMPVSKIASILGRSPEGVRRMAYDMNLR